jgi:hypothetical protein
MQRQQVAQRVNRQVQLGALLALGAVIPGPLAALGCGTQRPAVQDGCTGLRLSPGSQPQHRSEVLGQRLAARRKLRGTRPAGQAGPQDIAKARIIVENAKDVSQPDS